MKMLRFKTCLLIVCLCLAIESSQARKGKGKNTNSESKEVTEGQGKNTNSESKEVTEGQGEDTNTESDEATEGKGKNANMEEDWSSWENWGTCSATCGVGMRSRTRICTYPRQWRFRNHCFGDSRQVELCNIGSCAINGGWSSWKNWGKCSTTCGVGMRSRTRTCTNPRPEGFGDHCFGASHEVELCNTGSCSIYGSWNTWGNWGICSTTCGVGMRRRTRSCINPRTESFGDHCFGDSNEVELCNTGSCTANVSGKSRKVAFNAYSTNFNGYFPGGTILKFPVVIVNDGYGYNASSGIFKASVTGVYQFDVNVCNADAKFIAVSIVKGETPIAITSGYESRYSACTSVSTISRVVENENVYVMVRDPHSYMFTDGNRWSSFNGHLLYQDDQ